jgi:Nucleotidyltransferase domain
MARARRQIHAQSLAPDTPIDVGQMSAFKLPEAFLNSLVDEFTTTDTVAVALAGSYARGDATRWSDVDIIRYATTMPAASEERYTLAIRDGRLVSVSTTTIAAKQAELAQPEVAIFAVPGLRQACILHDPSRALAALYQQARDFTWEPLQAAASAYASEMVMGLAEEAHKLLGALNRRDESATLYAAHGAVAGLTRAVAVGLGILIESENSYYRQVQEGAGLDSAWTRYHRIAAGFVVDTSHQLPADAIGVAALCLYRETARLLSPLLLPRHLPVIEATLEAIATSEIAPET